MQLPVIDLDRHVIEPMNVWEEYVESRIRREMPVQLQFDDVKKAEDRVKRLGRLEAGMELLPILKLGDYPIMKLWNEALHIESSLNSESSLPNRYEAMSSTGQLKSMDRHGVAIANLVPTFTSHIVNHEQADAKVSLAYAQAYNRWLADYCQEQPSRLLGSGIISRHDPNTFKQQVEDIAKLGWKSIVIRPEVINGNSLGAENHDMLWQACSYHEISVVIHGGTHFPGQSAGNDRYTSHFALHACSHSMEIQMAFLSLIDSGVLNRFPNLNFAFLEAGASWLPHWLWRLDNVCYPEFPALVRDHMPLKPSEYFAKQCFVSAEPGEPCLPEITKYVGEDCLVYGSDFPHPDHLDLHSDLSGKFSSLGAQQLEKMFTTNALRFLNLKNIEHPSPKVLEAQMN